VNPSCSTGVGRCWDWIAGPGGGTTRRGRGTHGLGFESVEGVPTGGGVDREYHSLAAVATLGTVNPDGSGIIHTDGESWEGDGIGTNGFEPRAKAIHHGTARIGEGGLGSRVVFRMELESDGISRQGGDRVWLERKGTVIAYDNPVIRTGRGGQRTPGGGGSGRS